MKEKLEYKGIFVKKETHKRFAIKSLEEEKTHDELINYLLELLCLKNKQQKKK
jgi:hypothetical protein